VRKILILLWTIVANGNGGMIANYPSSKPGSMGKPLPVEIAIAEVNGAENNNRT
jgi:hypothetical protein